MSGFWRIFAAAMADNMPIKLRLRAVARGVFRAAGVDEVFFNGDSVLTEDKKADAEVERSFLEHARRMASICYEKRAEEVRLLDLRGLCNYTDFMIIASAASRPQMRGILRDIEKEMTLRKCRQINGSLVCDENWTLIDFGDMVVNLFSPQMREFYQIEQMWADAPEVEFPQKKNTE